MLARLPLLLRDAARSSGRPCAPIASSVTSIVSSSNVIDLEESKAVSSHDSGSASQPAVLVKLLFCLLDVRLLILPSPSVDFFSLSPHALASQCSRLLIFDES